MQEISRYLIDSNGDLLKFGSTTRFNRVLYGGHDKDKENYGKFFTFAGDAPIFMGAASDCLKNNWCYQAKCGVLKSGLAMTPGVTFGTPDKYSRYFHEATDIFTTYHHGYMSYKVGHFSSYFPEAEAKIEVYPLQKDDGYLVYYDIIADSQVNFGAVLGGMTDYIGRFDPHDSLNRDPELSDCNESCAEVCDFYGRIFRKSPDAEIITGNNFGAKLIADGAEAYTESSLSMAFVEHPGPKAVLKFSKQLMPGEYLKGYIVVLYNSTPEILKSYLDNDPRENIICEIKKKSSGIVMHSPDKRLDSTVIDQQIALDAAYHNPTFFHGAIGYHAPFLGWRGWYGGTLANWSERVRAATRAHLATQIPVKGKEEIWYDGADRPDLDHEGTQYHHLKNSHGKLTAMLYMEDIYDMQQVATDMILHYLERSKDLELGEEIFDSMSKMLAWEERIFDFDSDGLYQSFLNTWISDGHVYNGGGCTQSSAYNYRANTVMAKLGRKLGKDVTVFEQRAAKIAKAVNEKLYLEDAEVYAEYVDTVGNKLIHPAPELSTIYLVSESGFASPERMASSLKYTEKNIRSIQTCNRKGRIAYSSAWLPKKYSTCGLFPAENAALALAYFKNFRKAEGLQILDGLLDAFALSLSPGGISHVLTAHASNDYGDWDFTDVTSSYLRMIVEGLWGVGYKRLDDLIEIAPQLPETWNTAELELSDLAIKYHNDNGNFILKISTELTEVKKISIPGKIKLVNISDKKCRIENISVAGIPVTEIFWHGIGALEIAYKLIESSCNDSIKLQIGIPERPAAEKVPSCFENIDISNFFNAEITEVFNQKFMSPRPQGYSIGARINGRYAWEWNQFGHNELIISDTALRNAPDGIFKIDSNWSFPTPAAGANCLCVSVWDNFPTTMEIPLNGKATELVLFVFGATNAMQSYVENARVSVAYQDNSKSVCKLVAPLNFDDFLVAPVQQQFETFYWANGNHGTVIRVKLDKSKELKNFRIEGIANEVILGLLGAALIR